jgi:hypothetical protein
MPSLPTKKDRAYVAPARAISSLVDSGALSDERESLYGETR